MKFASIITTFAVFLSIMSPAVGAPSDPSLIVPGKRIGKLVLGPNGGASLEHVGEPDIMDAGMSQTKQVWLVKGNRRATLFIHTISNSALGVNPENGVTITEIRVSSHAFRTRTGISVGSTLAQVRRSFSQASCGNAGRGTVIYSDTRRGIAFEFANNKPTARCIGITVFSPGGGFTFTGKDVSNLVRDYQSSRK
jgi:hypothetical protein